MGKWLILDFPTIQNTLVLFFQAYVVALASLLFSLFQHVIKN